MGVYDKQMALAVRMISTKGQTVTWRKQTAEPIDDNKPWELNTSVDTDYSPSIVFLPIDLINHEFRRFMKDSNLIAGNEGGLMAAVDFTPEVGDMVIRGSEVLKVKNFYRLSPNGEIILYIIEFNL